MGIIVRKNKNQQDGKLIKEDTTPKELHEGTACEQEANDYPVYPYVGYHRSSIDDYLRGTSGSPYSRQYNARGEKVSCGINIYDRLVQRHEVLIRATGQPVTLLRRKWTGERCPCFDLRRGRSRTRCEVCFGTDFVGGYVPYFADCEECGRIYVRVNPTVEDLDSKETGLWQNFIPSAWGLPVPILRDRDVVITYDECTGEEAWRYEILNVTRNIGFFGKPTQQSFSMQRMDKTDPIYDIRIVDLQDNLVGDLAGPGSEYQDCIEEKFSEGYSNNYGDGYGDQGFSIGYFEGFNQGFDDGLNNRDFFPLRDQDTDGYLDAPYAPEDAGQYGLDNYSSGYVEGYKDGYEDGSKQRVESSPKSKDSFTLRGT